MKMTEDVRKLIEGEAKYARYHAAHCDMNRLFNHRCPYYRKAKEDKE